MKQEISEELITSALGLCGKEYWDMTVGVRGEYEVEWVFSHPSFFYYLLSHDFIEKYMEIGIEKYIEDEAPDKYIASDFGVAIYEYQKSNSENLIELLSKIGNQNK